ncbi:MAG TPA: NAD(P)-binding domain-containing protein [Gammaproteobacteria bacterium]|nr:NAD(P)-binding domain-containing protein [Gammaproteobacteria bacterium]
MRGRIVGAALAAFVALPAGADTIAVIGTGNVAGALGPEFAAQGHTIVYGSRSPGDKDVQELIARTGHGATVKSQKDAVVGASIVVIAVPGGVAEQVVKDLGDLSGKIIIDPTNRVNRGTGDGWADYDKPANGASNAELIQAAAPNAKVVKAFNTLNVRQMTDPETAGGPITIAIAGNDAAAKEKVSGLIKGMGLEVVDFGPLRFAHVLEEMLIVWANAGSHGQRFNYYLRPQPPALAPPAR